MLPDITATCTEKQRNSLPAWTVYKYYHYASKKLPLNQMTIHITQQQQNDYEVVILQLWMKHQNIASNTCIQSR